MHGFKKSHSREAPLRVGRCAGTAAGVRGSMIIFICAALIVAGCHPMVESIRRIWGSSTAALEKAKGRGIELTVSCPSDTVFDYILSLTRPHFDDVPLMASERASGKVLDGSATAHEKPEPASMPLHIKEVAIRDVGPKPFVLFQQRPREGVIVLMGVPGAVDTTEVGVFVSRLDERTARIEITSLSTLARDVTAAVLTQRLPDTCALLAYKDRSRPQEERP